MTVKLFGIIKEIIGSRHLPIDTDSRISTVSDLKIWVRQQYPPLLQLTSLMVAVDNEYADDAHCIYSDSEVALIPPVSGG